MPFNLKDEETMIQRGHVIAKHHEAGKCQSRTGIWIQKILYNGRVVLTYILDWSMGLGKKKNFLCQKSQE